MSAPPTVHEHLAAHVTASVNRPSDLDDPPLAYLEEDDWRPWSRGRQTRECSAPRCRCESPCDAYCAERGL